MKKPARGGLGENMILIIGAVIAVIALLLFVEWISH